LLLLPLLLLYYEERDQGLGTEEEARGVE